MQIQLTKDGSEFLLENHIYLTRVAPGNHVFWNEKIELEPYISLPNGHIREMGAFSYSWSYFLHHIKIGRYCSIASSVQIMGENHPLDRISSSAFTYEKNLPIFSQAVADFQSTFQTLPKPVKPDPKIGHDVWIGSNVMIARGISVGNGAVIGAGSVVTKDVPDYAIVGGAPAKFIRYRFPDEVIARLNSVAWWNYAFPDFQGIDLKLDIEHYLNHLERLIESGEIKEYKPKKLKLADLLAAQSS